MQQPGADPTSQELPKPWEPQGSVHTQGERWSWSPSMHGMGRNHHCDFISFAFPATKNNLAKIPGNEGLDPTWRGPGAVRVLLCQALPALPMPSSCSPAQLRKHSLDLRHLGMCLAVQSLHSHRHRDGMCPHGTQRDVSSWGTWPCQLLRASGLHLNHLLELELCPSVPGDALSSLTEHNVHVSSIPSFWMHLEQG